ncbi:hypothetical protein NQ318_010322 [Aromia moschata]|uniref:NHL repeat-containing protein 2 n=1 Tax=Aromia moschata TaxID=1265417 RepID=A0AAV8YGY7_9CUCU|nr:hypothetical protein NQ318_010322 [Aromia moschata]
MISDTGNSRILIIKEDGSILRQIGGKKLGFKDGSLDDAEFNNPQGLVFQNKDILFVADTENHAIRKINLKNDSVETVAGTGAQGHDRQGGKIGKQQPISSPWDLCIYKTPDMDLTFHPDGNPPVRDVLIIAMAGTHQIWALFLEDTVWWKCKKHPAGTCICIAAFAQPSGLALCAKKKEVYVADSESSSVRRLSLVDGKVTPVVGATGNPNNLFAFGDKDGALFDAKLQHSLGLVATRDEKFVFVADTYNHKLKKIDIVQNSVTTLTMPPLCVPSANPPGLCISSDNKRLYLVDTNNHLIKVAHLGGSCNITKITKVTLKKLQDTRQVDKSKYQVLSKKPVNVNNDGGKLIITFNIEFDAGLGLTEDAPQTWLIDLPDPAWSSVPKNGNDVKNFEVVISVPPKKDAKENFVDAVFNLVTCTSETCLPKSFIVRIPICYTDKGATSLNNKSNISLGPSSVKS